MRELLVRLRALQVEANNADLAPHRMADMLVQLTGIYGYVIEESREAAFAFNAVKATFLDAEEAANRSKIRAENTDAYRRLRLATDTEKVCLEFIRSIKMALRAKHEDMRLTR